MEIYGGGRSVSRTEGSGDSPQSARLSVARREASPAHERSTRRSCLASQILPGVVFLELTSLGLQHSWLREEVRQTQMLPLLDSKTIEYATVYKTTDGRVERDLSFPQPRASFLCGRCAPFCRLGRAMTEHLWQMCVSSRCAGFEGLFFSRLVSFFRGPHSHTSGG
eukprot:scaffold1700_cov259-Pinguiococcus_pyrenoidosus.AAC.2